VVQAPGHATAEHADADDSGAFGLALLLAGLAGWVDAAGLAGSGGVFISFMSGNTTDLAASLTHEDWVKARMIGAIIALFVAGVVVGETLEHFVERRGRPLVLALEAFFLASGAALHAYMQGTVGQLGLFPLVFAMGLQNATMHRAGGVSIGLTYVTGTLVQIGRTLAAMFCGESGGRRLLEYFALWSTLAIGAGCGAMAMSVSPASALAFAAAVAAALAVVTVFSGSARR
jgi:uncharacterized membrane protein YoaK (UPF0700 family)